MTQVIVELDDALARRLEQAAPARARQRSGFVREAIRRALDELAEEEMIRAYRAKPQDPVDSDLDPETWEARGGDLGATHRAGGGAFARRPAPKKRRGR